MLTQAASKTRAQTLSQPQAARTHLMNDANPSVLKGIIAGALAATSPLTAEQRADILVGLERALTAIEANGVTTRSMQIVLSRGGWFRALLTFDSQSSIDLNKPFDFSFKHADRAALLDSSERPENGIMLQYPLLEKSQVNGQYLMSLYFKPLRET